MDNDKQLQDEVTRTSDITTNFSEQMSEEFETFQDTKTAELKQGLTAYADSHISFYAKVIFIYIYIYVLDVLGRERSSNY